MRLKLATRISARQFRRNPTLQTLVEEAAVRYKAELERKLTDPAVQAEANRRASAALVRARAERAAATVEPAPQDPTKLPNGWFRRLLNSLGHEHMHAADVYNTYGMDIFHIIDKPRSEVANLHASGDAKRLLESLDKAGAAIMAARDEIRRKMQQDEDVARVERERQL